MAVRCARLVSIKDGTKKRGVPCYHEGSALPVHVASVMSETLVTGDDHLLI